MTVSENQQARCSAGLAVAFSTNSTYVDLLPVYKWEHKKDNMTGISAAGFDLYIKRKSQWIFAGSAAPVTRNTQFSIVADMDTTVKECLLYLPMYSELDELKIGIQRDASIKPIPDPFGKKVVFFGSSYTQGVSVSRPGMSYPVQIERNLNIHVCNLGFSGNSKLQTYFAEIIAAIDADAIVLDAFSNPDETMIRERLAPFLNIITRKHKKTPLIFVQTIHRGNSNFNCKIRDREDKKRMAATELMSVAMKKYMNVFFIENPLPANLSEDISADGVHPSDLGYFFWAKNLGDQLGNIIHVSANNKE
jgi:lysophospholipase L1-like esterase